MDVTSDGYELISGGRDAEIDHIKDVTAIDSRENRGLILVALVCHPEEKADAVIFDIDAEHLV